MGPMTPTHCTCQASLIRTTTGTIRQDCTCNYTCTTTVIETAGGTVIVYYLDESSIYDFSTPTPPSLSTFTRYYLPEDPVFDKIFKRELAELLHKQFLFSIPVDRHRHRHQQELANSARRLIAIPQSRKLMTRITHHAMMLAKTKEN